MTVTRVFLIGFMGSGKTTVGKMLSHSLNWRFIDLDQLIEKKEGQSITQIFATKGELAFRQLEHEVLKEVADYSNVIISTGGGTPCYHGNMDFINQKGLSIYLESDAETLKNRLLPAKKSRPLIADKSEEELLNFIKEKLSEREPWYNKAKTKTDATCIGITSYLNIIETYNKLNS